MSRSADSLFSAAQQIQHQYEDSLPPVDSWSPEFNGDLDMCIDREGHWYYQGDRIRRPRMVKMFSSILKREGEDYFLLTPVEKWRICVDVAPFVFVAMRQEERAGCQGVLLTTNIGHEVLLGQANPLWVTESSGGEPTPLALVHHNLPGLINRNVFYELVGLCREDEVSDGRTQLRFDSAGETFSLGYC